MDEYELAPTYDVDDEVYENGEDDGVEDYEYDDYGFDDYEDNVDKNDEQEGPEYQQGEDDILQTCKTLWNNTSISAQTKAAREKGKLEERRGGKGKMQFNVGHFNSVFFLGENFGEGKKRKAFVLLQLEK